MDESFDDVYARHGRGVYAYLARLTGNPWVAEELSQETFLRYLAHRGNGAAANGQEKAWLYRVATNLGIDTLRRRRGRPLVAEAEDAPVERGAGPDAEDLEARIRAELDRLLPEQRGTFLLRAHHQLPYREVAAAFGISERAAKARFRKTRDLLARRLAHLIEEEER